MLRVLKRLIRWVRPAPLDRELRHWRIVRAVNDQSGEAAVFRIRIARPQLPNLSAFKTAVRVTWPYDGPGPFPPANVREKQDEFDAALDELSGGNGYAALVRVATGRGTKEWLYYATGPEVFGENFNRLLAGHEKYPVSIEFEDDPDWKEWKDFVESLKTRRAI